jgi:uncharacterized membrane protein YphA (DoxX/SURF4 family)
MQDSLAVEPLAAAVPSRPLAAWVGRIGAFALGAVLLVAAVAKALDPEGFGESLRAQGLTFGLPAMVLVLLVLALEVGLGLLLVLDVRRPWTLALAGLLVATFVALNGYEWYRAAHGAAPAAGCGCFGNLVQRTPAQAFWQDLAMLVPALLLACIGVPRSGAAVPRWRSALALAGAVGVMLFAWRAPALPLDDLATRVRPGTRLAEVCAGSVADGGQRVCLPDVASEAASGRAWVVLVDLATADRWADELNRIAGREGAPAVVALAAATPDEVRAFGWQWGPTYTVHDAPPALFRPLYRSLPRSFLVEDGRVLRTLPGLPGGPDAPGESTR